ncbi:MAG: hypothetical protein JXK05_14090 [Campylobacterales bacterium]|nr:hypothetical protein [Campylobacterales bacterium]
MKLIAGIVLFLAIVSSSQAKDAWSKCFEEGFLYGKCSYNSMQGLPCQQGTDIAISLSCREHSATTKGIKSGMETAEEELIRFINNYNK